MATFLAGKGSTIKCDTTGGVLTDMSPIASNIQIQLDMDTAEVSAFAQAYKSFIAGQCGGSISFDFSFDATLYAVLHALWAAGTITDIEYSPAGSAVKYGFTGILSSLNVSSALSDAVKGSASFTITGAVAYS